MILEAQIAKEFLKGCKAKVGHRKGKLIKRTIYTDVCGKKDFLCYDCKRNINTHKESCERFLEFLKEEMKKWETISALSEVYISTGELEEKITDLKQAIKLYGGVVLK